jgi:hypothetical protein
MRKINIFASRRGGEDRTYRPNLWTTETNEPVITDLFNESFGRIDISLFCQVLGSFLNRQKSNYIINSQLLVNYLLITVLFPQKSNN